MFGVVCKNEDTLKNEPWTIAGPTDGSTNIVRHECNCDYDLATAIPDQLGAGYLGISVRDDCNKATFNPATGELTSKCFKGTIDCVDVNTNNCSDIVQPILVQGTDTDEETEVTSLTNKIEKTVAVYNASCYLCNDEETGDPIRKPVVYVPTLCTDELLGVGDKIVIGETDCDCSYPVTFLSEDDEGTSQLTTSCGCELNYNPSTGYLDAKGMTHKGSSMCFSDNELSSNVCLSTSCSVDTTSYTSSVNVNMRATTNYHRRRYEDGEGIHNITTNLIVSDSVNSTISTDGGFTADSQFRMTCADTTLTTNKACLSADTIIINRKNDSAVTNIYVNCVPYTDENCTSPFGLFGVEAITGNIRALEGITYDPVSCTLIGNFKSDNLLCWVSDDCTCCSCILGEPNKITVCTLCGPALSGMCTTITGSSVTMYGCCSCSGKCSAFGPTCWLLICSESTTARCEVQVYPSYISLYKSATYSSTYNPAYVNCLNSNGYYFCAERQKDANSPRYYINYCMGTSGVNLQQCYRNLAVDAGRYCARQFVSNPGLDTVDVTLICDQTSAHTYYKRATFSFTQDGDLYYKCYNFGSSSPDKCEKFLKESDVAGLLRYEDIDNRCGISTWNSLATYAVSKGCNIIHRVNASLSCQQWSDRFGNIICVCHALGTIEHLPGNDQGASWGIQFNGIVKNYSTGCVFQVSAWSQSGVNCWVSDWSSAVPIKGTMYGTASASAVNVCGTY